MNWEAIGAIAEVAAMIAVVISLVYVGVQIRQNTQEHQRAAFREVSGNFSKLNHSIIDNPAISELHFKALQKPDEMSDKEKYRAEQFYKELTWTTYGLHANITVGMMAPRMWDVQKRFLTKHLKSELGRSWWQEHNELYDEPFVSEITSSIEEAV